ncbi:hypothetical protein SAMN04487820_102260 [Actinopolyspora mzabensis]|uniref:Uncharacterized protein n=1 Tax=Actinopolyspora mzabensis TaxID=995066 RepID=A0A1G8WWQ0_ACTMZ|nr:hypothetical protein [Actinopolyspora mzabensis]SDJ82623.1 hypothetical protein SAMN04487820_102260 [Actinopolyspora mzabensis]
MSTGAGASTGIPEELRSLGRLFRRTDPTPERAISVAYGAARRLVRERDSVGVLEPLGDSAFRGRAVDESRGAAEVRTLSFAAPGRLVELELRQTRQGRFLARGIVLSRAGQPSPSGTVILRHGRGECRGELDGCGGFAVAGVPAGPICLRLHTRRADGLVTHRTSSDWFVC